LGKEIMENPIKHAPRFRAYLDRKYHALWMKRAEWDRLAHDYDDHIKIDITVTPLASIIRSAVVVGSYVENTLDGDTIIKIFRYDIKDTPKVINLDEYRLWSGISNPIVYSPLVVSCSTCADEDFISFLDNYVCIVPLPIGSNHHSEELPDKYK
jgi:hypothetical protein